MTNDNLEEKEEKPELELEKPEPVFGSEVRRRPDETMTAWSRRLINP